MNRKKDSPFAGLFYLYFDIYIQLEKANPFQNQYAFALITRPLYDQVKLLEQEWREASGLGKLHVKALFHQFVYELLQQL